jgi:hypothetical protein
MIMTAIVAVLMLMLVAMFVIMVMAVIMIMPVVMIVIVIVIMPMRMPALGMIGAARRLERLVDLEDDGAEALQHGADDMVA